MKDLALTSGGDLAIIGFDLATVEQRAQIAQRLKTRLKTFLGEWFLDTDRGVPYFEEIMVKNPDMNRVNAILSEQILLDAEITEILTFNADYDNATRRVSYRTSVQTIYGTINEIEGAGA